MMTMPSHHGRGRHRADKARPWRQQPRVRLSLPLSVFRRRTNMPDQRPSLFAAPAFYAAIAVSLLMWVWIIRQIL